MNHISNPGMSSRRCRTPGPFDTQPEVWTGGLTGGLQRPYKPRIQRPLSARDQQRHARSLSAPRNHGAKKTDQVGVGLALLPPGDPQRWPLPPAPKSARSPTCRPFEVGWGDGRTVGQWTAEAFSTQRARVPSVERRRCNKCTFLRDHDHGSEHCRRCSREAVTATPVVVSRIQHSSQRPQRQKKELLRDIPDEGAPKSTVSLDVLSGPGGAVDENLPLGQESEPQLQGRSDREELVDLSNDANGAQLHPASELLAPAPADN